MAENSMLRKLPGRTFVDLVHTVNIRRPSTYREYLSTWIVIFSLTRGSGLGLRRAVRPVGLFFRSHMGLKKSPNKGSGQRSTNVWVYKCLGRQMFGLMNVRLTNFSHIYLVDKFTGRLIFGRQVYGLTSIRSTSLRVDEFSFHRKFAQSGHPAVTFLHFSVSENHAPARRSDRSLR
jgi:hypothetical protein